MLTFTCSLVGSRGALAGLLEAFPFFDPCLQQLYPQQQGEVLLLLKLYLGSSSTPACRPGCDLCRALTWPLADSGPEEALKVVICPWACRCCWRWTAYRGAAAERVLRARPAGAE